MSRTRQIIQDVAMLRNSGRAFEVDKGQVIRVIGTTIADLVAFNRDDLTERFDQARGCIQWKALVLIWPILA